MKNEQAKYLTELKYTREYINGFCGKLLDDDNPLCWQAAPLVKQLFECGECDQSQLTTLTKRAEDAEAERDELREIVGKLPMTKDGVYATVGTKLYHPELISPAYVSSMYLRWVDGHGHCDGYGVEDFYSTREAAEIRRKGDDDE